MSPSILLLTTGTRSFASITLVPSTRPASVRGLVLFYSAGHHTHNVVSILDDTAGVKPSKSVEGLAIISRRVIIHQKGGCDRITCVEVNIDVLVAPLMKVNDSSHGNTVDNSKETEPIMESSPADTFNVSNNNMNRTENIVTSSDTGTKMLPSGTSTSNNISNITTTTFTNSKASTPATSAEATNVSHSQENQARVGSSSHIDGSIAKTNANIDISSAHFDSDENTGQIHNWRSSIDDIPSRNKHEGQRTSWRSNDRNNRTHRIEDNWRTNDRSKERMNSEKHGYRVHTARAEIRMPTGVLLSLSQPAKPKCSCTIHSTSIMVPLRPSNTVDSEEYQMVYDQMNDTIRQHRSGCFTKYNIITVYKVRNCCLWLKYRNRQLDISKDGVDLNERMLFHGSLAVDDIVRNGFDERNSNIGSMFGAGIYFAEHSSKSNQYVLGYMGGNGCDRHRDRNCCICLRKMLLCRVTLGSAYPLTESSRFSHAPPGHHSVEGRPSTGVLKYPEYVIYRGEQAYPEYQISYKIVP